MDEKTMKYSDYVQQEYLGEVAVDARWAGDRPDNYADGTWYTAYGDYSAYSDYDGWVQS